MIQVLALLLSLFAAPAFAQNTTCSDRGASDNSNACANTRYVTTAITNAYPNTWLKSVAGTSVNATGATFGPTGQAMYLSGTYTGAGYAPYALMSVTDSGSETTYDRPALWIVHNVTGGEGSRTALKTQLNINSNLPCTVTIRCFHIANFPQTYVNAELGGNSGTYKGDTYGGGCFNQLGPNAKYINSAGGCEFNVSVQTGASVKYKYITSHIGVNSDAVAGTDFNAMSVFLSDSSATYKWPMVVSIGRPDGVWPLNSSSVVLGSTAPSAGTRDVGVVIECTGFVITTACIRGTGFSINGSGAASVASLASASTLKGTAIISTGSAPTITGSGACTLSAQVGGATAGKFTATAACATGQTYTISAMPAAPNGYVCDAGDRTTSGVVFQQTSDSTTTAVFTIRTTSVANNDIIQFKCQGY